MPRVTPEQLRERLAKLFPDALVPPPPPPTAPEGSKHGAPPNMLITNDTVISPHYLTATVTYLRDQLGYTFLSDIAVVDFLADGVFELGYRFYHPEGGGPLVIKVRVPREKPEITALTPIWPGANFHEREAFDLFGITFIGHPFLRRIYMWDEFEGFPMRKDFPKQGDKYIGAEE